MKITTADRILNELERRYTTALEKDKNAPLSVMQEIYSERLIALEDVYNAFDYYRQKELKENMACHIPQFVFDFADYQKNCFQNNDLMQDKIRQDLINNIDFYLAQLLQGFITISECMLQIAKC